MKAMKLMLLLSGPVAVGKTSVAKALIERYKFHGVRSGGYLSELAKREGLPTDRAGLQALGDKLDSESDYSWLIENIAKPAINASPDLDFWIVDCVRKKRQTEHFRDQFAASVCHVHLTATEELLEKRYSKRIELGEEYLGGTSYEVAIKHPNEVLSRNLGALADLNICVDDLNAEDIAASILAYLMEKGYA